MNKQALTGHPRGHRDDAWREQKRMVSLARSDQKTQKERNSVPVNERQPWWRPTRLKTCPPSRIAKSRRGLWTLRVIDPIRFDLDETPEAGGLYWTG
jgi:hypothetical protein